MKDPRSHLIAAVDVPDREAALAVVDRLAGHVGCFKLGLQIFVSEGPPLVREIVARGEKVFLDLKLHDIPNTVAAAVGSACRLGVRMLTLHASGGAKMLEAARKAAEDSGSPPLLLSVTALTSLSAEDARGIGVSDPLPEWVDRLARLSVEAGIPGLVCSAKELPRLRGGLGGRVTIVTPGIRPAGAATQDQARISLPGDAIRAGADYLVVGRPILNAADPAAAADAITAEIGQAFPQDF